LSTVEQLCAYPPVCLSVCVSGSVDVSTPVCHCIPTVGVHRCFDASLPLHRDPVRAALTTRDRASRGSTAPISQRGRAVTTLAPAKPRRGRTAPVWGSTDVSTSVCHCTATPIASLSRRATVVPCQNPDPAGRLPQSRPGRLVQTSTATIKRRAGRAKRGPHALPMLLGKRGRSSPVRDAVRRRRVRPLLGACPGRQAARRYT